MHASLLFLRFFNEIESWTAQTLLIHTYNKYIVINRYYYYVTQTFVAACILQACIIIINIHICVIIFSRLSCLYICAYAQERNTVRELLTRRFWCTPPRPLPFAARMYARTHVHTHIVVTFMTENLPRDSFYLERGSLEHLNYYSPYILITIAIYIFIYICPVWLALLYTINIDTYCLMFHPSAIAVLRSAE